MKGQQKIRSMLNKKPEEEPDMVHGILPEWLEVDRGSRQVPSEWAVFCEVARLAIHGSHLGRP